ncbi:MAG: peptidase S10 [Gemmatimonadota bacterium]|nr:peptidase S10 [Gemmatimonadota bacterium]
MIRGAGQAGPVTGFAGTASLVIAIGLAPPAVGQNSTDGIVETRHSVEVRGEALEYTAHAGVLPIRVNATGEPHGHVFFVAYTVDPPPGAPPRPLTFLWNGGPGANSTLVHLDGFGPKRLDPSGPGEDGRLAVIDNETTWLDATDLVFVDPIGTGYSRPTRVDYESEFYATKGDIASVAEFIRVFLTRFDAWDAPLVVGGESYGAWRAGGVAEALERAGISVAGVILISGGIPFGPVVSDEMRAASFVPTRTAAAHHHGRLAPELGPDLDGAMRAAEEWAMRDYGPALADPTRLSAGKRAEIAGQLSRFTGLPAGEIDDETLVVRRQQFAERLLAEEGVVLGRFDTRVTTPVSGAPESAGGRRARAIRRYLRFDLGFETDLAYQGLETGYTPATDGGPTPIGARWSYDHDRAVAAMSGEEPEGPLRRLVYEGPPGGSDPWLARAMDLNPEIRVFVAAGIFDSLNSCTFNEYLVTRLEPRRAANVTLGCYVGGHMMYEDEETRPILERDAERFLGDLRSESDR